MLLKAWMTYPITWRTCNIWQCYSEREQRTPIPEGLVTFGKVIRAWTKYPNTWRTPAMLLRMLGHYAKQPATVISFCWLPSETGCQIIENHQICNLSPWNRMYYRHKKRRIYHPSIHSLSTHSYSDITILVDWAQKSYWLTGHKQVTGWLAYLLNPQSLKLTMSQPTAQNLSNSAIPPQFNPFPALRAWYLGLTPQCLWQKKDPRMIPRMIPALRWAVTKATLMLH